MKIRNIYYLVGIFVLVLVSILTLMFSETVLAAVPYDSLYYDGSNHSYSADKIYLSINGEILDDASLPIQPINIDGTRTLVPLREVLETLGATVNFDATTNAVTVKDGSNIVVVVVDSKTGYINGEEVEMDVAPKYVAIDSTSQKKVMIPLRFVGEGLGYEVNYDAPTRTVTVDSPKSNVTDENTNTDTTNNTDVENNNATKVEFSRSGNADLFTIYGEDESPELKEVTVVDGGTMYIDILKPNTILNDSASQEIIEIVEGLSVSSYKVYDLNETTTRIEVSLSNKSVNNVIKNGTLTKVYIKPLEEVGEIEEVEENNNGNTENITSDEVILDNRALILETTPRTATLKINKSYVPAISISNITHLDNYMEYQYVLTSTISLKEEIPTQNIPVYNEILNSVDIINENNKTNFVFNGENVLYANVTEDSEYIIFNIKSARDVYDKIIVIDAGHGGTDPGTSGSLNGVTYYEKDVVLDIAKKTVENISKDSRFKVYETRPIDFDTPKPERTAFSSEIQADVFISIHANAAQNNSIPNGIETFYYDYSNNNSGDDFNEEKAEVAAKSKAFATVMQENLISATLLKDRTAKHGNYLVLRDNKVPSILIETGFMTNPDDLAKLIDENYRTLVAEVIADTVINYYDSY